MQQPLRRASWAAIVLVAVLAGAAAGEPPHGLLEAAKAGNRTALRALLKQRPDVGVRDADGTTALHWIVEANDLESARLLIAAGGDVNVSNRHGVTPLALAALNGSAALLEVLIQAGADPNAAGPAGETPLMTAARTGTPAALEVLLAHGARIDARESSNGQTALMWAAAENNAAAIAILIGRGADPNARSNVLAPPEMKWVGFQGMVSTALPRGGWTPLMYAARQNAIDAAAALVEGGANLNVQDEEGATALVLAIINAHYDLAKVLLESGADPNIADVSGMAALYAAVDMNTLGPMLMRPLPKLVSNIDAPGLARELLASGANPNARLKRPILGRYHDAGDASLSEGTTPLMRAAKNNDVQMMRLLLDAGADATLTQKDHTNAVMVAASGARAGTFGTASFRVSEDSAIEAIRLCLERGADVDAFNAAGQTALHIAAGRGADKIVRFLADRGASLEVRNKQGHTPLDLALGLGGAGRRGGTPVARDSTVALLRELLGAKAPQEP